MMELHAEKAFVGAIERDVSIVVDGARIVEVAPGVPAAPDAIRLRGVTVPGFYNAHSHAFHRALRGRTHTGSGDFWRWRRVMYSLAERLDPDSYRELATATYAEMVCAGFTTVAEFHYLHHDEDGARYSDRNEMGTALMEAAEQAGIRVVLLDACYLRGGLRDGALGPVQRRFSDGDVDEWSDRIRDIVPVGDAVIGAAIHSVRAVDRDSMTAIAGVAGSMGLPLHVHVSEQALENDECRDVYDMSPTELLADAGVLGPLTTAIHATHVTPVDVGLLAGSRSAVGMCPTTERDLGDGVGPTSAFLDGGIRLCFGTDSHAVIDPFEEARAAELDERLVARRRGISPPETLLIAAAGGAEIARGSRADLVTVRDSSSRMAGGTDGDLVARLVFSATAADVSDVFVGGRQVVRDGLHTTIPDPGAALDAAIGKLLG